MVFSYLLTIKHFFAKFSRIQWLSSKNTILRCDFSTKSSTNHEMFDFKRAFCIQINEQFKLRFFENYYYLFTRVTLGTFC